MLGKRSRPLIMKLSGSFQPSPSDTVNIATTITGTAITSPRSPLDFQIPLSKTTTTTNTKGSPAIKNKFTNENIINCSNDRATFGIGLGLIIALEESSKYDGTGDKILVNYGIRNTSTPRSVPIPVNSSRRPRYVGGGGGSYFRGKSNDLYYNKAKLEEEDETADDDDDEEEDYTLVTRRGGVDDKAVTTRVYCDNGRDYRRRNHHYSGNDNCRSDVRNGFTVATTMIRRKQTVFQISSGFCGDEEEDKNSCSDFLSSCHLCRKTLIGKDIYMYRGEKAFCSEECRQRQISSDERKERKFCRSEAAAAAMAASSTSLRSSSPSTSRSPYHYEAMFTAGMVAV